MAYVRHTGLNGLLAASALWAAAGLAVALPTLLLPERAAASVVRAAPGQGLTQPSLAAPGAVVAGYLRARGADEATAASLRELGAGAGKAGLRHVRMEQQVGGLTVHGSYIKATVNARGELVHLIERTYPAGGAVTPVSVTDRQALQAAMARVHPGQAASFGNGPSVDATTHFAGGAFFHEDPQVTRVLIPQAGGGFAQGFLVQTWTQRANLLDHTLVSGQGEVLSVQRRTANDSYNVFTKDPGKTQQTVVSGPGAGNAPSPAGWLSGAQTSIAISGNNVNAYLDADANNRADPGGAPVVDGNFVAVANLNDSPATATNRAVAVQNLFYLNNVLHDILYRHGFNEGAGNFQVNNFGLGGAEKDPVNAEAQDGSGTDNANFATPRDGRSPRMQMYLWTGAGATHEVVVSSPAPATYGAMGAAFGAVLNTVGIAGAVVPAVPADGCTAVAAGVSGKVALIDRGSCDFSTKALNAQQAGATAVIVANNAAGAPFTMGAGAGANRVRISAVMISQADGSALRATVAPTATLRKKAVQPNQIDGDVDSDIVFHEYGHGLTWRMIGDMSGPLAGAIGEGASDTLAFLLNGDDRIGEYAFSDPNGIRRAPYAGYPKGYGDVTGDEVHDDGEIYAAAMWRLGELYRGSGLTNDDLLGDFVDGMNFTPPAPAFENMRNGMLDSLAARLGANAVTRCTFVWQAFAQFGIGDGAIGTATRSGVAITPSNVARTDCSH